MRAGNGPLLDIRESWAVGKPLYRPEAIAVPTLLVRAEWDADVSIDSIRDLFTRLTGAP